jgi:transposase-like protein
MPLRILSYISRIYEKLIDIKASYQRKLLKIPAPEFYVLYNGVEVYPQSGVLKLSEAFLEHSDALELTVRIVNINYCESSEVLKKSRTLNEYSRFIDCTRGYKSQGLTLMESVELAVKDCLKQGILSDFLKKHASEVVGLLFTEFNMGDALLVSKEEGKVEGRMEGIAEGRMEGRLEERLILARGLLSTNLTNEEISQLTGLTYKEIVEMRG